MDRGKGFFVFGCRRICVLSHEKLPQTITIKKCAVVSAFDSSVALANIPLWIACFFLKEEMVYLGFGCGHTLLSRQFLRNKRRCST